MIPVFRYIQLGYPFQHLALKYAKILVSMSVTHRRCKRCNQFIRIVGRELTSRGQFSGSDDKRVIVQTHVNAIMDLSTMTKENATDLRRISDGAAKHLHALQALKRPTMRPIGMIFSSF